MALPKDFITLSPTMAEYKGVKISREAYHTTNTWLHLETKHNYYVEDRMFPDLKSAMNYIDKKNSIKEIVRP